MTISMACCRQKGGNDDARQRPVIVRPKILTLNQSISSNLYGFERVIAVDQRVKRPSDSPPCPRFVKPTHAQPQTFRQRSYTYNTSRVAHLNFTVDSSQDQSGTDISSPQSIIDAHPLPQTLDLVEAQVLCDRMRGMLKEGPVVLDASAVERMSTPCAQVLLATGYAADSAGISLQFTNPSDVFRGALTDLGLQSQFSKWMI